MLSPKSFWPPRNFGAIDAELADLNFARFVVIPTPYDSTTTWRGGARDGPMAILDASMNMELYDPEIGREICDSGIHTTDDVEPVMSGPRDMATRVETVVGEVLDLGKVPFLLGGEHSISLGGIRSLAARSKSLTVFQIDAHADLRHSYCETEFGHGCVMRRSSELPNVRIVQFGLRSMSLEESRSIPANVHQFWADEILGDFQGALAQALSRVEGDIYLTFDVDGCDPSWIPDTGTPEPGGFSFYQVRDILKAVCATGRVKAVDCVELAGGNPASAFAIARLLYKTMGYLSAE